MTIYQSIKIFKQISKHLETSANIFPKIKKSLNKNIETENEFYLDLNKIEQDMLALKERTKKAVLHIKNNGI